MSECNECNINSIVIAVSNKNKPRKEMKTAKIIKGETIRKKAVNAKTEREV